MILRKNEAKCEKCKSTILDMPIHLSDYFIRIIENPAMLYRDTICCSNTNWKCPVCGHINFEKIEMYLNEDDYIALIASRYNKDFSVQEVRFN